MRSHGFERVGAFELGSEQEAQRIAQAPLEFLEIIPVIDQPLDEAEDICRATVRQDLEQLEERFLLDESEHPPNVVGCDRGAAEREHLIEG